MSGCIMATVNYIQCILTAMMDEGAGCIQATHPSFVDIDVDGDSEELMLLEEYFSSTRKSGGGDIDTIRHQQENKATVIITYNDSECKLLVFLLHNGSFTKFAACYIYNILKKVFPQALEIGSFIIVSLSLENGKLVRKFLFQQMSQIPLRDILLAKSNMLEFLFRGRVYT